MVWLSDQRLDVFLYMGNILKGFINIGCDEEADKYGCDWSLAFDIVLGELRHYLMTMERVPQNCDGFVHSVITQLFPTQNNTRIQVIKNLFQLVR